MSFTPGRRTRAALAILIVGLTVASPGPAAVTVVNMIPKAQSGETNQDSEPNLAVNPSNTKHVAGSAFTPNPLGGSNAPIFVSTNGGLKWRLNAIVPSVSGLATGDITLGFSGNNDILYAGILRRPGSLRLNILRTDKFTSSSIMTVLVDRNNVDQPYVQAIRVGTGKDKGKDRVYIGNNDFAAPDGKSATVDRSLDAASAAAPAGFATLRIEARDTSGQDGPPIRPAVHSNGTVYGVFYGWRDFTSGLATTDVVVVRDDNWAIGPKTFQDLVDGDGLAGKRVVTKRTVPFVNSSQADFGQERFVGSNLSIAVDPSNSKIVYVAWADGTNTTDYTLHVRSSMDAGATWSKTDRRKIPRATNPALAINSKGKVGFLYQKLQGTGAKQRWVTRFETTTDDFATHADLILADVPATTPAVTFIPYIGDYVHVLAVGPDFYGIFSANNTPNLKHFPQGVTYQRNADFTMGTLLNTDGTTKVDVSIDPFFFKVTP